jgi:hypothetical protein
MQTMTVTMRVSFTDASSNDESDSADDANPLPTRCLLAEKPASNNHQALGEQLLARTLLELEDMGGKFRIIGAHCLGPSAMC